MADLLHEANARVANQEHNLSSASIMYNANMKHPPRRIFTHLPYLANLPNPKQIHIDVEFRDDMDDRWRKIFALLEDSVAKTRPHRPVATASTT